MSQEPDEWDPSVEHERHEAEWDAPSDTDELSGTHVEADVDTVVHEDLGGDAEAAVHEDVDGVDGPPVSGTGDFRVDTALSRLQELAGVPVGEHVAVFEDVHAQLRTALADLDGR